MHLAYKTGVSFTNMQFSIYKQASRLTNWHLGLQLSNFLKILDVLELSESVVGAIPDMDNRPSAYIDKYLNKTKKRARNTHANSQIEFKWGDEE